MYRQLLLCFQNVGTLLTQLRAVAAEGNAPALLGVTHMQRGPSHTSLTDVILLGCFRFCMHTCKSCVQHVHRNAVYGSHVVLTSISYQKGDAQLL